MRPYNPRRLSDEQLNAGQKILTLFLNIVSWVLLLAQMQSGKTDTFLYVAAEMLRKKNVKKVIIMCGNNEKALKKQLEKDLSKFLDKYRRELGSNDISEDERDDIDDIITFLKENIEIKYGADLDAKHDNISYEGEIKDTFIIIDESHFAASKINRPNKFLERMGLSATGNPINLDRPRNNFVLSVSATPYAELSDIHYEIQHKEVVRLVPGEGYRSLGHYLRTKKIIGFKSWSKTLATCFKKYGGGRPKYSIVRVNGNSKMEEAKKIATDNGWNYKVYDSESVAIAKKTNDSDMILSLDELADAPSQNTVIFIRGMCRMGKVLPKEHIAFVMETSKRSKTDCLVQGLLGRVCGYHDFDIHIYIHEYILQTKTVRGTTELEKFVELMEGVDLYSIPCKAAHIISGLARDNVYDLYPIVIRGFIEDRDDPDYSEFNTERIKQYVKTAITDGNIQNKNSIFHTEDITKQVNDATTDIVIHKIENSNRQTNPTFLNVPHLLAGILADREEKNSVRALPGCGINSSKRAQVNAWVFPSNQYNLLGFPAGTIVLQAVSKFNDMGIIPVNIPKTTGLEAFTSRREDDTELIGNGTQATTLPPESSTSVDAMKTSIVELIRISLVPREAVTVARCIPSNQDADTGEWQGIMVNDAVYVALQKGGIIYAHIKSVFNLKIKTSSQRGQPTKACRASGLKRLCKIEW